jgi:hypothetical protein
MVVGATGHQALADEVIQEPPPRALDCGTCGLPYEMVIEISSDEIELEIVVRR